MEEKQSIFVYDDSLSWGIIPGTRQRFEFSTRWPGRLEQLLLKSGYDVRVIEDCLNGRRTAWTDPVRSGRCGAEGLAQRIEAQSPLSLVIVVLGTNDFQSDRSIDAQESANGLSQVISEIRGALIEPGMLPPRVLIIAPPEIGRLNADMAVKFGDAAERCRGLARAYKSVAERFGCHFWDAGEVCRTSSVDGVHLDELDHAKISEFLAAWLPNVFPLRRPDRGPENTRD